MYGFLVTNSSYRAETLLSAPRSLSACGVSVYYSPMPKFEHDKLFFEDEEKIVLLDGVVFNNHELMEAHQSANWQETFNALYYAAPRNFMKELRGSFCGVVVEKGTGTIVAFTNQSGEKAVYYTCQSDFFLIASHNNLLTSAMRELGVRPQPNPQGLRELLCTGSILHGGTPFAGVSRLMAGKRLVLEGGAFHEERYHMFRNVPEWDLSPEECVEEYDKHFRKAVDRIFAKSAEYGYTLESDLSGGIDSRMVTWVAHDLGYHHVLNVCYCMEGNLDHTVSSKIARDLGNDYFFLPMDGGDILLDVDEVVDKFGGQVSYLLCTGANRAMKQISDKSVGLTAMGLLGELPKGEFTQGGVSTPPDYSPNRYSSVIPFEIPASYKADYETYEQMVFYEYGTLFIHSSILVRQQQCEAFSPFVDVDYLEFIMGVPPEYRKGCRLLTSWMVQKYPQAAKYVWQTMRMPVDCHYYGKPYFPKYLDDVRTFFVRCVNKAARVARLPVQISLKADMNPFDLWLRTNPEVRNFVEAYYRNNLPLVEDDALRADLKTVFERGGARDKLQVVDVLAVFKRYFHG